MNKQKVFKRVCPIIAIAVVMPVLSANANADSGSWSLTSDQGKQGQKSPQSQQPQQPQQAQQAQQAQAWLGVSLAPVPEVMSRQLGEIIPAGQGVMVQSVSPNSPAANAGLQDFDIILGMGDQKIYSAEQLAGLVRSAQPESEVTLKMVRQGKVQELPVKLGKQAMSPYGRPSWSQHHPMMRPPMRNMMPPMIPPPSANQGDNPSQGLAWDSFESVQVNTLADGRYRAEISYKDEKGKVKSLTFEGKRDELEGLINKQEGLPMEKKQALLNALNMNPEEMFNQSQWGTNFFNAPFFRNGFGQSPFFQRGFPMMPNFEHLFQNSPTGSGFRSQGDIL